MPPDCPTRLHEHRLERLIDRLPAGMQRATRWLRHPPRRWIRVPAGIALICGGILGFLPLLGFWMLPLGLVLLAEDFTPLWWLRGRMLDWIARRRPHWFPEYAAWAIPPRQ